MTKCWNSEAALRPSFTELVDEVSEMLKNVQQLKYQQELKDLTETRLFYNVAYGVLDRARPDHSMCYGSLDQAYSNKKAQS